MSQTWDYDVAVAGSGPAGATTAALLARGGARVLLIEKEPMPRFHIGESLLPYGSPLLEELGLAPLLRDRGYVVKRGASFVTEDGGRRARLRFAAAPDVPAPATWHVLRADFDRMLSERAAAFGARVRMPAAVERASFHADHVELDLAGGGGPARVTAGMLVDATGRHGLLARALSLRVTDPELRKVAIFSQFRGALPAPGEEAGDIRIIARADGGWFWIIPLPEGRISVGVVFDHAEDLRRPGENPDETLLRHVRATPSARECLHDFTPLEPARWEGGFSYTTKAYAGDRWLLVGDAGSFLDPVFSTGVQLAMAGGREAAGAILGALRKGPQLGARNFRAYGRLQRRRYRFFRPFVLGFYRPAFRDRLFQPEDWPAGAAALVSALAGNDNPGWRVRLRQRLFFLLVALSERFPSLARPSSLSPPRSPAAPV